MDDLECHQFREDGSDGRVEIAKECRRGDAVIEGYLSLYGKDDFSEQCECAKEQEMVDRVLDKEQHIIYKCRKLGPDLY